MNIVFDDARGEQRRLDILARRPEQIFSVDGHRVSLCELEPGDSGRVRIVVGGRVIEGWRWVAGNDVYLRLAGRHWHFRRAGVEAGESVSGSSHGEVRAEMPGTVVALYTQVGADVAEGDRLLTIESMKLQMTLTAPRAGRIQTIHMQTNSSFDRGATLVSFEPEAAASPPPGGGSAADSGKVS